MERYDIREASSSPWLETLTEEIQHYPVPDTGVLRGRNISVRSIRDTLMIEGINATQRLTEVVYDEMQQIEISPRVEEDPVVAAEIAGIIWARDISFQQAEHQTISNFSLVTELHSVIGATMHDAGLLRRAPVRISGSQHIPPNWMKVPDLVEQVTGQWDTPGINPVLRAAWAHATLASIHPFTDGNGRTAREVQDFLLLKYGMFPVGIPASHRGSYYACLEKADAGDFTPLAELIGQSMLTFLTRHYEED